MHLLIPKIPYRFLVVLSLLSVSCRSIDYFEKNEVIPGQAWQHNRPVTGVFSISDTASLYNVSLVLRHTDSYHFNNIWIKLDWQSPADSVVSHTMDLTLGSDAEGWEGSGMNDIREVRKLLTPTPLPFRQSGNYSYSISHIMREDPLQSIMSVGLRVEKAH